MAALLELEEAYAALASDPSFWAEFRELLATYVGRPTPVYRADRRVIVSGGSEGEWDQEGDRDLEQHAARLGVDHIVAIETFAQFGDVDQVNLITDKFTGDSKGFGFVEMANNSQADAAIKALNGTDMKGRNITVNQAKPRSDRPSHGGGRRW